MEFSKDWGSFSPEDARDIYKKKLIDGYVGKIDVNLNKKYSKRCEALMLTNRRLGPRIAACRQTYLFIPEILSSYLRMLLSSLIFILAEYLEDVKVN